MASRDEVVSRRACAGVWGVLHGVGVSEGRGGFELNDLIRRRRATENYTPATSLGHASCEGAPLTFIIWRDEEGPAADTVSEPVRGTIPPRRERGVSIAYEGRYAGEIPGPTFTYVGSIWRRTWSRQKTNRSPD